MSLPKLRHKPRLDYKGLTIVLSNPSRFDKVELLSGTAGHIFKTEHLHPDILPKQCDIRTSNTIEEGLLPNTRAILLLGHRAMIEWTSKGRYVDYSLGEQRGCPLEGPFNLPTIASYFPQDAIDIVDWETSKNTFTQADVGNTEFTPEEDDEEEGDVKRKGFTKRSNWRFWLQRDTKKILSVITEDKHALAKHYDTPHPVIYPELQEAISVLDDAANKTIFMDIENHPETSMLYCIGFAVEDGPVYVVPIFRYNGAHAYPDLGRFLRAYVCATTLNRVVCHNGFTHDLLMLAAHYRMAFGRLNGDTLLMAQRCFPEAEKSLGHCGSLYTWEPYHKDEGCYEPHSERDERALWHYNAKDVALMRSVWKSIHAYSRRIPGLAESIAQANESIYPYVLNSLYGIRYDAEEIVGIQKEYDGLMTEYLRLCRIALGRNFLPTSTKDVPAYFYGEMGYSIQGRTKKGNPSCGKGAMFKMKLKHPENILIDIILKYRSVSKASGSLKFTQWNMPWKLKHV